MLIKKKKASPHHPTTHEGRSGRSKEKATAPAAGYKHLPALIRHLVCRFGKSRTGDTVIGEIFTANPQIRAERP
jgi:hypothetical protein